MARLQRWTGTVSRGRFGGRKVTVWAFGTVATCYEIEVVHRENPERRVVAYLGSRECLLSWLTERRLVIRWHGSRSPLHPAAARRSASLGPWRPRHLGRGIPNSSAGGGSLPLITVPHT